MRPMQLWGADGVLSHFGVAAAMLCAIATSVPAEGPTSTSQKETAAILSLVESHNKTRDKQKRKVYVEQLNARKQNWEAMFLAASKLRLGQFDVLMPMLAEPGKAVVPKIVQLLTWNPEASSNAAVHVTKRLGDDTVPLLIEQYDKPHASVLVRRYAVISIKYIMTKNEPNKADAARRLQWTLKAVNDKDDGVTRQALHILGILFTQDNAKQVEPVLKAKLKDTDPRMRGTAIIVLMKVKPEADYVVEHVMTSALKSKDRIERIANMRFCTKLPVSAETLDVLYKCAFDKDPQIRIFTAQAIVPMKAELAPLIDKMLKKLQDGNTDSLPAIMAVLRNDKKNSEAIEKSLVKLLSNKDAQVRRSCLGYFVTNRLPLKDESVRKIAKMLSDPDRRVRGIAIRAIHRFKEKPFVKDAVSRRVGVEKDRSAQELLKIFMAEYEQSS